MRLFWTAPFPFSMSVISIESTAGIVKELVHSPEVLAERSPKLWQTPPRGKECFIPAMATLSVRCATTIAPLGCFLSTCISFCASSGGLFFFLAFLGGIVPFELDMHPVEGSQQHPLGDSSAYPPCASFWETLLT